MTLAEHYGVPEEESVEDVAWIRDAAQRGWILFMKDDRIRRRPAQREAIHINGARCFCLANDAQQAWYAAALGFTDAVERVELTDPAVRTVVLQTAAGLRVELIERAGAKPNRFTDPLAAAAVQGYGHWALEVEDLEATFDRLTTSGATPVSGPADAAPPGDRYDYIHDPEGNLLDLIQVHRSR